MRVPKYAHHRASGQAFVKIQGRYVYLGRYGSPESRKRYAEVIGGEPAAPQKNDRAADGATILDMIAQFLERNPAEYPPDSPEPRQFPVALRPLAKIAGHIAAGDFGAHHLADVRRSMVGLSRGVVNRRLARIKLAFRRSELWGIIPSGVYARLAVVRGTDTKAAASKPVEPARFEDVLATVRKLFHPSRGRHRARGPILARMLLLGWWTGARPGELRIMRPMDIDRTGPVWIYRPSKHKNAWRGQSREIVLGPKCQAVLRHALEGLDAGTWLFPSRTGEPYTVNGFAHAIHDAAQLAGVSLHAYQLRHAAKRRIETAHGETAAKAILGQESLDSTRRYARAQDVELAKRIAGKAG